MGGAVALAFACEGARGFRTGPHSGELRGDRAVSNKQRRKGLEEGEPVNSKPVFSALCTEDILIARESCGWAPSLETLVLCVGTSRHFSTSHHRQRMGR